VVASVLKDQEHQKLFIIVLLIMINLMVENFETCIYFEL
jgi:hypothetical protein